MSVVERLVALVRSSLCSLLACLVVAGAFGCSAPRTPKPTAEFLALRPQKIAVAEPYGGGDEVDKRFGRALADGLRKLGYVVPDLSAPADAELHFFAGELDTERSWDSGQKRAHASVTAELRCATGVLWKGKGRGSGWDEDDDDDRSGLGGVLSGILVDGVADAMFPPDYEPLVREAVDDAVRSLLREFPKRLPPLAPVTAR